MSPAPPSRLGVPLAFVVMMALFALLFPAVKRALEGFGVATADAIRFGVAAVMLAPLVRGRLASARGVRAALMLNGALGLGLYTLLLNAGVDAASASLGALVIGLEPVAIALFAVVLGEERLRATTYAGIALGFVGVAIVAGAFTVPLAAVPVTALVFLLLEDVSFGYATVQVRRLSQGVDVVATTFLQVSGALVLTGSLALVEVVRGRAVLTGAGAGDLAAAVYVGAATVVSYLLMFWLLLRVASTRFGVVLYLLPPLGVLASWALVGEQPHARTLVGGLVILLAVWIEEHGRRREAHRVLAASGV